MELTLTRDEAERILLAWANAMGPLVVPALPDAASAPLFNKIHLGDRYSSVGAEISYEPPAETEPTPAMKLA